MSLTKYQKQAPNEQSSLYNVYVSLGQKGPEVRNGKRKWPKYKGKANFFKIITMDTWLNRTVYIQGREQLQGTHVCHGQPALLPPSRRPSPRS